MIEAVSSGARIFTVDSDEAMPAPGEDSVSVTIEDDSGQPIAADIHQGRSSLGGVCGGDDHIALSNRKPLHLHLQFGLAVDCGSTSIPTTGTITFTFHS